MLILPLAFTAFIARFPVGIFIYLISSNAFTLAQNLIVYRWGSYAIPGHSMADSVENRVEKFPTRENADRKTRKAGARRRRKKKRRP